MEKIISVGIVMLIVAGLIVILFKYLLPCGESSEVCAYLQGFLIAFGCSLAGNKFINKIYTD